MMAPDDDPYRSDLVQGPAAGGLLGVFNRAGVLAPADVHVALRLAALGGEDDELVALAVALAVRAPRAGHVSADLRSVEAVVAADAGEDTALDELPWPTVDAWLAAVVASPLVTVEGEAPETPGPSGAGRRPLHLLDATLYLDRHWRDELAVAADLRRRALAGPPPFDAGLLEEGLARLFPEVGGDVDRDVGPEVGSRSHGPDDDQRRAAATAVANGLCVIAGGPGTGKTTTVARVLALLHEQQPDRAPTVALAAPTGKASARLEQAVRTEAAHLAVSEATRHWLAATTGSTLHRLLGARPGSARFRHDRDHRLAHDVVVVDEASMVSLSMMRSLLEAVRPDARLLLVGDPQQLASVEAGAVLADIVAAATPAPGTPDGVDDPPLAGATAVLRTTHRFGGALGELATAVRLGDERRALQVLQGGAGGVTWIPDEGGAVPPVLRSPLVEWAGRMVAASRSGSVGDALASLGSHRVLCAHRSGPVGVGAANHAVERWLFEVAAELASEGPWYTGRPVMVGANDYGLRVFNGDTGVVVADPGGGVGVAFDSPGPSPRLLAPSRLSSVETVFATTVHKSQGSEYDRVTLLLPPAGSRLLTRELLYTAVTRARHGLTVTGTEEALVTAVRRPVARASGLTARLW